MEYIIFLDLFDVKCVPHIDSRYAAGKHKQTPADWFIKKIRLSLKVSTHSNRQRLALHLDENANETFFIIGESLTVMSPV